MTRDDKLSNEVQKRNVKDLKAILKQMTKKHKQFESLITKAKQDIIRKKEELAKLEGKETTLESEFDELTIQINTQGQQLFDNCRQKIAVSESKDLEFRRSERKKEEEITR